MFITKTTSYPKLKTFAVDFSNFSGGLNTRADESILPLKYARKAYNFSFGEGTLKQGLGIEKLTFPYEKGSDVELLVNFPEGVEPLSIAHYRYFNQESGNRADRLMVYGSDKYMYYGRFTTEVTRDIEKLDYMQLNEKPKFINYRLNGIDTIIFTSPSDPMTTWNPTRIPEQITTAPSINSMCLHYERLFATVNGEKSSVWFSDDLDPTNWTVSMEEGGFIEMLDERGNLNSVISFNDYLYVFRDFGIARVTAFAEQENFSVTQVYTSSTKIYPDSACICGDSIIFLASDGLYSFNGVSVSKLQLGFEDLFAKNNEGAKAQFYKNRYYLSCKMCLENFNPLEKNTLLEYDPQTGDVSILYGYCIEELLTINTESLEKLVVIVKTSEGNVLGQVTHSGRVIYDNTTKVWESAFTSLGYNTKVKQIREISLLTNAAVQCTITTENGSKTVAFSPSDVPQRQKVFVKGKMVKVKFETSDAECNISSPQLIVKM